MSAPVLTSSDDRSRSIPHVPALDGLRGLAVAGVLLFHADHLPGGFLGVDLFFTLSGFLITSLLLVERERTGSVSLRGFWGRRLRRLLPAMVLVVAASAVVAPAVVRSDELDRFRTLALATLGYVANWAEVARASDYFALFDTPTPLDHAWSLAIEEQFYLLWPLLVVGVARVVRPRLGVRLVTVAGIVGSVAAAWWALREPDGMTRAYYGTDTRAASILVGAGLATFTAGVQRTITPVERLVGRAAPLALVAVVASWFLLDGTEPWLHRVGLLGHASLTALVIAGVSGPGAAGLRRFLSSRWLVRTGVVSYGLYLWHWPVYVVLDEARTGLDGWALTAVRIVVSAVLAELSYRLVEAPVRYHRYRLPRPGLTAVGAVATASVIVVVLAQPGGERTLPPVTALSADTSVPVAAGPEPPDTVLPAEELDSVLLVGDSQAFTLAFEAPSEDLGIHVDNAANLGCGLSSRGIVLHGERVQREERCTPILEEMVAEVEASDADVVAVLSGVWESSDQLVDGDVVPFGDPAWFDLVRDDFLTTVGPMTATHDVALVTTPCFAPGPQRDEYALEDIDARIAAVNDVFRQAARDLDVPVVDLAGLLCPGGTPVTELDGYVVRPDGVHFDEVGARVVWPWLAEQLQETLEAGSR